MFLNCNKFYVQVRVYIASSIMYESVFYRFITLCITSYEGFGFLYIYILVLVNYYNS